MEQVRRFAPRLVAVADDEAARAFRAALPEFTGELLTANEGGLERVATAAEADLLVSGLVGALGLMPTLAGIAAGKHVALANKEVLVVAGELVTRAAREAGVSLLPLDSEHNAIFQALRGHRADEVKRLILTASGGPFRTHSPSELRSVTREQALQHPTWKMGNKITIDSATLMNKGLEVIEAHWLFHLPPERIDVVIHPQSIVHSMVEYVDGSVLAQLGISDMTIPISYILGYPDRLPLDHLPALDLPRAATLSFEEPDHERFPCLGLAYRALHAGGSAPAVLNGANEAAVAAFLRGEIEFLDIPRTLTAVLDVIPSRRRRISIPCSAATAGPRRGTPPGGRRRSCGGGWRGYRLTAVNLLRRVRAGSETHVNRFGAREWSEAGQTPRLMAGRATSAAEVGSASLRTATSGAEVGSPSLRMATSGVEIGSPSLRMATSDAEVGSPSLGWQSPAWRLAPRAFGRQPPAWEGSGSPAFGRQPPPWRLASQAFGQQPPRRGGWPPQLLQWQPPTRHFPHARGPRPGFARACNSADVAGKIRRRSCSGTPANISLASFSEYGQSAARCG